MEKQPVIDMDNFKDYVNHRFYFQMNDDTFYRAKLVAFNRASEEIFISRIISFKSGIPYGKTRKYKLGHIKTIKHLSPPVAENPVDWARISTLKGVNLSHVNLFVEYEEELFAQINTTEDNGPEVTLNLKDELVESVVISNIDARYNKCVEQLQNCNVIGLALHGVAVGSLRGRSCWLTVKFSPDEIYHFDLLALRNQVFNKGLKSVLENKNVLKVVYNSAFLKAALVEEFEVNLVNVFDVRVVDVIYRNKIGVKEPIILRPLHEIICDTLGEEKVGLYIPPFTEDIREGYEVVAWLQRPMKFCYRTFLCKEVAYLTGMHRFYDNFFKKKRTIYFNNALQFVSRLARGHYEHELEKGLDMNQIFLTTSESKLSYQGEDEYVSIPDEEYFRTRATIGHDLSTELEDPGPSFTESSAPPPPPPFEEVSEAFDWSVLAREPREVNYLPSGYEVNHLRKNTIKKIEE